MHADRARLIVLYSLGAGAMDAITGLMLVAVPQTTLRLFGASMPGGSGDILMRFVGAFVLGVGCAYLWALCTDDRVKRALRLQGTWGATATIRASIALFTTGAVLTGNLEYTWLVVSASDALLAAFQFRGLAARWFDA